MSGREFVYRQSQLVLLNTGAAVLGTGILKHFLPGGTHRSVHSGYENASKMLATFMSNKGGRMQLSTDQMRDLLTNDRGASLVRRIDTNNIREYVESHYSEIRGKKLVSTDIMEWVATSKDWHNALNGFRVWVSVDHIKCTDANGSALFWLDATVHLEDVYDWDFNKDAVGAIGVVDRHNAMLHRYGVAREFEIRGEYTEGDIWLKGQRKLERNSD